MSFLYAFIPALLFALLLYALWPTKPGFQKEFRDSTDGLPDLLRYARVIKDGVVLGKNGELIAGFFFRGVDLDSSTNEEIMSIMVRLNAAFCRFGSGWMMHIDGVRGYAMGYPEKGDFPHPVLRMMDAERRAQFLAEGTHFDSQYACFLTWLPPTTFETKAISMLYDHSDDVLAAQGGLGKRTIAQYEAKLEEFRLVINSMFHNVSRIGWVKKVEKESTGATYYVDELVSYLQYCVTGIRQSVRVSMNNSCDVDMLVGAQDFVGGARPRVGRMNIRVVSIDGFPSESAPLVMTALNRLPIRYRWSTRYIFQDPEIAKGKFARIRSKWRQKLRPVMDEAFNRTSGPIDQDALEMVRDAEGAMSEATSGAVRYGDYTSVVVLMDEDSAAIDAAARLLEKLIRDLMFTCRTEEMNSVEAYLGSLPGHGYENCRHMPANTLNLAYLFPACATWSGLVKHPCKFYPENSPPLFMADASGGMPFGAAVHFDDIGHFLSVGPTGAGKSTLCAFIEAQQFRYKDARVFLFEKGYSGYALCKATGGRHFDIGSEEFEGGFAPLADVDIPHVRLWAEEWLSGCLALQGVEVTPKDLISVRTALHKVANEERRHRQLTTLCSFIQDEQLKQALSFYTLAGGDSLLDSSVNEESIEINRFNVFEMEHLMEMGEKRLVPILLYLFHRIERSLKGEPTLIILDEAWLMLKHPIFRDRLKAWLKTMRKANVGVGFFTQEIADLMKSEIRDVIFSSCQTRILLPNPGAVSLSQKPMYQELGLNDQQIALIAGATRKRDYYYSSPYGHRMFQLSLEKMNLAFVGVSGKEEVALAREYEKKYGDRWTIEWTRLRAGSEWANTLARLYQEAA